MPADRKNDYEFNQKYYLSAQSELTVPAGYKIDYIPAPVKKSGAGYTFEAMILCKQGQEYFIYKDHQHQQSYFEKSRFRGLECFIAEINKFYNDQVVLSKQ